MITIIYAPPRTGKTCLMTHLLRECAFDRQRNRLMQAELMSKRANGFDSLQTIPQHCVSANYDCKFHKFGYTPRVNRRINPFRLGFDNKFVKTHFNLPYECIGITEAQKYFNSRMAIYYPDWQSRWFEQHGHNGLDIFLDTQRPMLIDVNIRELASFIEVLDMQVIRNKIGVIVGMQWHVRRIANSKLFDRYMASGGKDETCYVDDVIFADYNVWRCYNHQNCKPKFYAGHFDEDIDYFVSEDIENSKDGYIRALEESDDEYVTGFYQKRSSI